VCCNSSCYAIARGITTHRFYFFTSHYTKLQESSRQRPLHEKKCVFAQKRERENERDKETSLRYITPLIMALLVNRNVTTQVLSGNGNISNNTTSSNTTNRRNSRTQSQKKYVVFNIKCRNPSLRLVTKARACKNAGQEGRSRVTFPTPGSAKECEGMNPHTPKGTPTLGVGVPVDFEIFREQLQESKLIRLRRSLYH
jgi:hypothetical protein